ncbi:response regulator [Methylomagnum ishizawai]|uniref:response regulator n=1 Tax=Methylomagnum ishizawai TaxID=1760988 RepID=UPI001C32BD1F|nr:response regulator [Methylomagnum ishizawai]BBL76488.1 hypothetical protein MishRS11D_35860 [Methylomagnum ishizawai]
MTAAHVLLVEDEEIIATIITEFLGSRGIQVSAVADGEQAWALLRGGDPPYETILLDRELPGISGMELLQRIKTTAQLSQIPVVMETSSNDAKSIQEGLDRGAYYYLTKPFQPDVLLAIVNAAVGQYRDYRRMRETLEKAERTLLFMESGRFRFHSLAQAQALAGGLAQACPEPLRAAAGLQELLINAVEHGNLGISYQEKSELILAGRLQAECERRLGLPEHLDKTVEVVVEREADRLCFTISDQGAGFDWHKYLDFDPGRIFDPNGRGIALARKISFDQLDYLGDGSSVQAVVKL